MPPTRPLSRAWPCRPSKSAEAGQAGLRGRGGSAAPAAGTNLRPEKAHGRRRRGILRAGGEAIYQTIHALPRGELKKELLACLRQGKPQRGRRSRADEKRGKIRDMTSIHERPAEIQGRLVPGHWEGDLIKGAGNRSSIGTLVERTSGKLVLVKLTDAKAATTRTGFVEGLLRVPAPLRLTMTYGKEMAHHKELATGIQVYFADPHAPWQRGSNENTNGLLRQYLPKGADLSEFDPRRDRRRPQLTTAQAPCLRYSRRGLRQQFSFSVLR